MPHKIRITKSKFKGNKTFMDDRQELGKIHCVTCDSKIEVKMCNKGNVKCAGDNRPCHNPDSIELGKIPIEHCCDKC